MCGGSGWQKPKVSFPEDSSRLFRLHWADFCRYWCTNIEAGVAKHLVLTADFNNRKQETLILEIFFHPKMMITNLNNNQSTVKSDFEMIVSTKAASWTWTTLNYPQHTTSCVLNELQQNWVTPAEHGTTSLFSLFIVIGSGSSTSPGWSPADRSVLYVCSYDVPTVNPTGLEMSPQNFINELTEHRGDDVVPCERALERAQHIPSVLTAPRTLSRHMLHHTDGFPPARGKNTSFTQIWVLRRVLH